MNKEKWQRELEQMQLSDLKKQQMKQFVTKKKPKRKVDWTYRFTLPTFILLALFCTYLVIGDKIPTSLVHQASIPDLVETDHTAYFNELSPYLSMIFMLLLVNGVLGNAVIMKTTRWQQPRINKFRNKRLAQPRGILIIYSIIVIIVLNYLIYLNVSFIILKWCIVGLLFLLHALILLFLVRKAKGHYQCPHCRHELTKKEAQKIWRTMLKPMHCPSCKKEVFHSKQSRKLSGLTNLINLPVLFVLFNMGISFGAIIVCVVVYGVLVVRKILPLTIELEKKDEFLW